MARKKQKVSISERIAAWRGKRKRTKKQVEARKHTLIAAIKVAAVMCLAVAGGAFLRYAEGYVGSVRPVGEATLVLLDVPEWVNFDLNAKVVAAAGGNCFPVVEDTAEVVARNLATMSWLDDIQVEVTHEAVRVAARWRKPLALIQRGPSKFYVDSDLVVLDYMPMAHLPIVEVEGVRTNFTPPAPGTAFNQADLAAAIRLIIALNRMDAEISPKNPLLEQLANIDVSNYNGRKNDGKPHIVLHAKDGTELLWGAELGEWSKQFEATDKQKLAKLYVHYAQYPLLNTGGKYVNLYNPQDRVPQPIDKIR